MREDLHNKTYRVAFREQASLDCRVGSIVSSWFGTVGYSLRQGSILLVMRCT